MQISEFFSGPAGEIYSAGNVLIIMVLMMIVSFRLFLNRRKRAYLSMTFSFLLVAIQYAVMIYFSANHPPRAVTITAEYAMQSLKLAAFILLNMGVYQLYNRSRRKDHALCLLLLLGAALISVLFYTYADEHDRFIRFLGIDIYMLFLMLMAFYLIPPRIGQVLKYRIGLLVFLLAHVSGLINRHALAEPHPVWKSMENVLPIVYFSILFLFLFDRVVEIMQAVYQTSITDGLTGLYNRSHFLKRAARYAQHVKVGVIFSDIDNFKKLNDTKGHQAGDDALKQVAAIMREEAEDIGFAGRYGGEEMVMIVCDPEVSLKEVAEQFRRRVERETDVTVSVGIADVRKGTSLETALKHADEAMYHSKTNGKNRVTSYAEIRKKKNGRLP